MLASVLFHYMLKHLVSGITKDVTFSQWANHEPNGYEAQCIGASLARLDGHIEWSDFNCNERLPFICQGDLQSHWLFFFINFHA